MLVLCNGGPQGNKKREGNDPTKFHDLSPMLLVSCHTTNRVAISYGLDVRDNVGISIVEKASANPLVTGVICGCDKPQITSELPHENGDVAGSSGDVLFGIEGIKSPKAFGSRGHELHKAHGTLRRNGPWIPSRLHINECGDHLRLNVVVRGVSLHVLLRERARRLRFQDERGKKQEGKHQTPSHAPASF